MLLPKLRLVSTPLIPATNRLYTTARWYMEHIDPMVLYRMKLFMTPKISSLLSTNKAQIATLVGGGSWSLLPRLGLSHRAISTISRPLVKEAVRVLQSIFCLGSVWFSYGFGSSFGINFYRRIGGAVRNTLKDILWWIIKEPKAFLELEKQK